MLSINRQILFVTSSFVIQNMWHMNKISTSLESLTISEFSYIENIDEKKKIGG